MKLVIEPVFEADFLPCSFGFRPKRSAHDALQVLIDQSWKGRRWALETDIANCFDAIPHSGLMSAIEERICDRHLLKLLRAMLRAGVMQDGAVRRDVTGTPQGGVVSPVCCATSTCTGSTGSGRRAGQGCWCVTRMTWSCCATARREAEAALVALAVDPGRDGPGAQAAKTRIVHLREGGEGLDFLGFHHRRVRGERGYRHLAVPRPLALTRGDAKSPRPDP